MSLAALKQVLYHTIRYSQQRLAVGESGKSDTPIMSYQLQQNAILPLLAKTVVYNIGHNVAKNIFAQPKGHEHEMIRIFCVVKSMMGWHFEQTSSICRERCGGGSYLSHSVIPEGIAGSHSAMTAEGDNRVLMQKVVKDIISDVQKKIHRTPKLT